MITSKQALMAYMQADKIALGRKGKFPMPWDFVWRFERILRKCEYYKNCRKDPLGKLLFFYYRLKHHFLGVKCGFTIPINVFGKGLSIAHIGTIVINHAARVGDNCRLHVDVNIGTAAGHSHYAPKIGNNVYIGPGAKLFGSITIADNIAIGANAVVNKDFTTPGVTLGGVPAKIISDKGSDGLIIKQ